MFDLPFMHCSFLAYYSVESALVMWPIGEILAKSVNANFKLAHVKTWAPAWHDLQSPTHGDEPFNSRSGLLRSPQSPLAVPNSGEEPFDPHRNKGPGRPLPLAVPYRRG